MIRDRRPALPLWAIGLAVVLIFAAATSLLVVGQMVEGHAAAYRPVQGQVPACPAAPEARP